MDYGVVRTSGRDRVNRIMNVDGYSILRENNYVVRGGTYCFGAEHSISIPPSKNKRVAAKREAIVKKPRMVAPEEVIRKRFVAKIAAENVLRRSSQLEYLAGFKDTLAPFVERKVYDRLSSLEPQKETFREIFLQPELVQGGEMRDYQLIGLNFLARMHNHGCPMILGDEMGLGKTLQTIAFICYLKESLKYDGPSLIVCPLSVVSSWVKELERWAPALKVLRMHSSDSNQMEALRQEVTQNAHSYDVILTTYEMTKNPKLAGLWHRQHFRYLVLDEGHIIKNHESLVSIALRKMHFQGALLLTGTPLQNNLTELWSLLNFMYHDVFTTRGPFDDGFGMNGVDPDVLHKAHALLRIFMLRRLKAQVEKLMPKKIETKVLVPLSNCQVYVYKALLTKNLGMLANLENSMKLSQSSKKAFEDDEAKPSHQVLNNLVMNLRKCCNHPFLFPGVEIDPDTTSLEELIASSGKLAVLDKLLHALYSRGHRVVLFSQFTKTLDIIEDYVNLRGYQYCRFDGSVNRVQRTVLINRFNAPNSKDFIFFMSTRAGGMGINLQTADTCILFDSDWNPQPDLQAMARVHRIGQTKVVHVYRFVSRGTIEERVVQRAEKKLYLDQMVNSGTSVQSDESLRLTTGELLQALKFGSDAVFGSNKNSLPKKEDIEVLIDRNRQEDTSAGDVRGGLSSNAAEYDPNRDLQSTRILGGVNFSQLKSNGTLNGLTGNLGEGWKRERKQRIVMIHGKGSGYGASMVPVLKSNNYDLENGERSVFEQELKHLKKDLVSKNSIPTFEHQDHCQSCGVGGELILCRKCPIAMHVACAGFANLDQVSNAWSCSHHRCTVCDKNTSAAGGLLFRCQSCVNAYCEDCHPTNSMLLHSPHRMEDMGYDAGSVACYVNCSDQCTQVAKADFGWEEDHLDSEQLIIKEIDVSHAFD